MGICYNMICNSCKWEDEVVCKYDDRHNQHCPTCGDTLKMLVSMPMNMAVSHRDGTNRFKDVKTAFELEKAIKKANNKKDKDKLKKEHNRINNM